MPIKRRFFDWSRPILPSVVDCLREECNSPDGCNLSNVVTVFPGAQAGRRFLELLTLATGGRLSPPEILTVGSLPEKLYTPQRPFASELTQQLAWAEALRRVPLERLRVVVRRPPAESDDEDWHALGLLLSKQHRELAADGKDFSDVAKAVSNLSGFNEQLRWDVLREVQSGYLAILDSLELWDRQTARLVAIEKHECRTSQQIYLIGTVDLNGTLRKMLDAVAANVTACIHAPESLEQAFDSHGCLIPAKWESMPVDLAREQIMIVEQPLDQAQAVVRTIAGWNGEFSADEITIGAPDNSLVPLIQRTLGRSGIPTSWVVGQTVVESGPYRMFEAISDYLTDASVSSLAALLRHPDVSNWIDRQGFPEDWLTPLDEYQSTHFPRRLDEFLGDSHASRVTRRLHQCVQLLMEPLHASDQPLDQWTPALLKVLMDVFSGTRFDLEDPRQAAAVEASRLLHETLQGHALLPAELSPAVSAVEAIHLTLRQVRSGIIAAHDPGHAVQISGWLELPQDDAPALVLTGFNEGFIPSSLNHDLFLPNALREKLNLDDNSRRYARDCYALQSLLHSRKQVMLIAGRTDGRGEPILPSRLMFAAPQDTIATRVLDFCEHQLGAPQPLLPGTLLPGSQESQFHIPRPQPLDAPRSSFRVTEFGDYLASPYRYYLRHIVGLQEVGDEVNEIDAAGFGTLLHDVLREFGQSRFRTSTNADEIRAFLDRAVALFAAREYGGSARFPVQLQLEHARLRLHDFARWQADHAAQGWRIHLVEASATEPVMFRVDDDLSVALRGRIDRIDVHETSGQWLILDYKTGDEPKTPDKNHLAKSAWVNLQLPLYRHLAQALGLRGDFQLGYVVLPRARDAVQLLPAEWSEELLREADEVARQVIRDVRAGRFWVPLEEPCGCMSEFDGICQSNVIEQDAIL